MSDMNSWMALRSAMQDDGRARPPVRAATWRRVAEFARPHRRTITLFLLLATGGAILGVAIPLLAGQAVDAIVEGGSTKTVVALAVAMALVALLDTAIGLLERLTSSRLGEGLILDLRRRVFEHVQAMPIAFFTRTRTGALVSRLNSDVIGAQRAFTSALAGVVTNVIVLVLTLGGDGAAVLVDHPARRSSCCRSSSSRLGGSAHASACSSARRPPTTRP